MFTVEDDESADLRAFAHASCVVQRMGRIEFGERFGDMHQVLTDRIEIWGRHDDQPEYLQPLHDAQMRWYEAVRDYTATHDPGTVMDEVNGAFDYSAETRLIKHADTHVRERFAALPTREMREFLGNFGCMEGLRPADDFWDDPYVSGYDPM